ncbi:hypothetical protein QO058_17830 [Bosea vestrisii]|uniref:hypothetical protein n=1 Tax=Bosea vestrisii TaxID=151416 RepID=UPI0024DF92D3|nr:hypothetical protein [Bosea vestrisii]WID94683.1 hypothetical protein QO058_17830 [Bosea vestrisii]
MSASTDRPVAARAAKALVAARPWASPVIWLAAFLAFVLAGLLLPLRLPLGSYYWDTAVYFDAAQRIREGQVPNIDFFAPVGPLGYYLVAGLDRLFPNAHPLLTANWGLLPIALPLLAIIVFHVARSSRRLALALLLPFLLFASLPINLHEVYPLPGFDGYGHYNRHVALLLYILVAVLTFARDRRLTTWLVAALMLTLFLVKITGAVAGAMLVGYAALTGRMRLRDACLAAAAVIGALAVIDVASGGLTRAYVDDILTLLKLNTDALLPRFLTVASFKFEVIGPTLVLIGLLAYGAWRTRPTGMAARLRALAVSPVGWLAIALLALTFFETQNTGSLEFIGLWPILLVLLLDWRRRDDNLRTFVLLLLCVIAAPSALVFIERAARATLGAPTYLPLAVDDVGKLGRVSVKQEIAERAPVMLQHYANHQSAYADLAATGQQPSLTLYSEIDHHAIWLLEIEQGILAIKAWEQAGKRELNGVFTLDFVDVLNYLLDRRPPRHVPIGIDPTRSNPKLEAQMIESLRQTDAILAPKCPLTSIRAAIFKHFAGALEGRSKVALAPCWDLYLKP